MFAISRPLPIALAVWAGGSDGVLLWGTVSSVELPQRKRYQGEVVASPEMLPAGRCVSMVALSLGRRYGQQDDARDAGGTRRCDPSMDLHATSVAIDVAGSMTSSRNSPRPLGFP